MSYTELGTEWVCDLCEKVEHTTGGRPWQWNRLNITMVYNGTAAGAIDVCNNCFPLKSEGKKKAIGMFKKLFNHLFVSSNQTDTEEIDPTPYCTGCGAMSEKKCKCGPDETANREMK